MTEEKIILKHKNGEEIVGVLALPKKYSNKIPLLILMHGFSSSKDSSTNIFLSDYFKNNIATFRFDLRCHGESSGDLIDITLDKSVEDLELVINNFKAKKWLKEIYLLSSSYTGIVSLIVASRNKLITKLGLRAPVSDRIAIYNQLLGKEKILEWQKSGYWERHSRSQDKNIKIKYDYYKSFLPYHNKIYKIAAEIKTPTLIVQGDQDQSVPIKFTKKLYNSLTCKKEFKIIKGANHYFDGDDKKKGAYKYIIDFFEN